MPIRANTYLEPSALRGRVAASLPHLFCPSSVATGSLFTAWWTMGGNRATDLPLLLRRGLWKSKPKMVLFLKQSMSLFSYSSHIFIIWIVAWVRVRVGVRTKLKVGVRTKNCPNNYFCIWGGMLCKYVLVFYRCYSCTNVWPREWACFVIRCLETVREDWCCFLYNFYL